MEEIRDFLDRTWQVSDDFSITGWNILVIIIILIVTWTLLWSVRKILQRREKIGKIEYSSRFSLYQLTKYFAWLLAIILILKSSGVEITLLLAGSAALLVGVGLGLQQTFNDVVSGIILLFEGTIKVGDIVEVDSEVGKVNRIGLRISKITTRDDTIMIIPNSKFVTDNVVNWSHVNHSTRFCVEVGVAYGSDVSLVTRALSECANEHSGVAKSPKPFVRFKDFGASSLDFQLYFWSDNTFLIENTKSDLRYMINKKFGAYHIRIPFPQRDLHFISSEINFGGSSEDGQPD